MSVLEDCMRDDLNARARAAHRGARSGQARHRQLSGRAERGMLRAESSAAAGARQARAAVHARAVDRARRLQRGRRRRATSALRRAPRCGCATPTSCAASGAEKDADGNVDVVHCTYDPDTRSGTPGADARKVKGNIHWLSAAHAVPAEVRLYDRLFAVPFPGARNPRGSRGGAARRGACARASRGGRRRRRRRRRRRARRAQLSRRPQSRIEARDHARTSSRRSAAPRRRSPFQFERHGYFVADLARPRARQAGVQPRGDAQGFLGAAVGGRPAASATDAVAPGRRRPASLHDDRQSWRASLRCAPRHRIARSTP